MRVPRIPTVSFLGGCSARSGSAILMKTPGGVLAVLGPFFLGCHFGFLFLGLALNQLSGCGRTCLAQEPWRSSFGFFPSHNPYPP